MKKNIFIFSAGLHKIVLSKIYRQNLNIATIATEIASMLKVNLTDIHTYICSPKTIWQ